MVLVLVLVLMVVQERARMNTQQHICRQAGRPALEETGSSCGVNGWLPWLMRKQWLCPQERRRVGGWRCGLQTTGRDKRAEW